MAVAPIVRDQTPPPSHIAIIMDGNGRWAKARGLPRFSGHQRGARAVRAAVEGCREMGVRHLTLFAFSSENWRRPESEVNDLMGLLRLYVERELATLHSNGVRLTFIGDRAPLSRNIREIIAGAEERTRGNTSLRLIIALNYGGRGEIVEAARRMAAAAAAGDLAVDDIDEAAFQSFFETAGVPDPDLVIRTSGEQRLSNFLLWQVAYSELAFVDTLWPDFTKEHLAAAVQNFQRRERRYGAASA
jgi:undecaprenyl diphosphate synthase